MLRIVADVHESQSGVPRLLVELGLEIESRRLPVGDYDIGGGGIVERKTVRGLHAAVIQGRFWAQVGRLRKAATFPYVLIEGGDLDDGPLLPTSVRGICIAMMDLGIDVVRSSGARDSALWLYRLADRRCNFRFRNAPAYAQRPKREAGFPAAEAALACVPGLSSVGAQALLARFGSLAAVVVADPDEWQRVRGVGPVRAKAMAATFHGTEPASCSGRSPEQRDPST